MEKRDIYLEKIKAQIEQYGAKIDGMRGKAAEVSADMKLEYLSQVDKLQGKKDILKAKYQELKKSSEGSWEDVKAGTESAWSQLKESFEKAGKHFK
ncbi:MAG TPA: hypothetical protein VIK72_05005 [Clostridiaceae bacterium]